MADTSAPASPGALASTAAEAARYALLRRLAPSMRHHLVVNLQPIGMIYEVMDRRLRADEPDLSHVRDSAGKINGFARAALQSCIDVVGWIAPDDTAGITLEESVRECAALLATSLSFRGYALRNGVGSLPRRVRRSAVRSMLPAVLIHCTDHIPAPSDLELAAVAEDDAACLTVTCRETQGGQAFAGEPNYRKIVWDDLRALAAADGVALGREGTGITLRLPWLA